MPFFQVHFFSSPLFRPAPLAAAREHHGLHHSGQNPLPPADDPRSALGAWGFGPGPRGGGAMCHFARRASSSPSRSSGIKSGAKAHASQTAPIDGRTGSHGRAEARVLVPDPQQVPMGHPEPRTVRWRAPRRESCGNDPPVRCEEKLNYFEIGGASGRRFLSVPLPRIRCGRPASLTW